MCPAFASAIVQRLNGKGERPALPLIFLRGPPRSDHEHGHAEGCAGEIGAGWTVPTANWNRKTVTANIVQTIQAPR